MNKRLGENDAQAVNLLLDHGNTATGSTDGSLVFAPVVGDSVTKRIGAVETVLRLIAEMPAADPAPDLVKRTMERIRRTGAVGPRPFESARPIVDADGHHLS